MAYWNKKANSWRRMKNIRNSEVIGYDDNDDIIAYEYHDGEHVYSIPKAVFEQYMRENNERIESLEGESKDMSAFDSMFWGLFSLNNGYKIQEGVADDMFNFLIGSDLELENVRRIVRKTTNFIDSVDYAKAPLDLKRRDNKVRDYLSKVVNNRLMKKYGLMQQSYVRSNYNRFFYLAVCNVFFQVVLGQDRIKGCAFSASPEPNGVLFLHGTNPIAHIPTGANNFHVNFESTSALLIDITARAEYKFEQQASGLTYEFIKSNF